MKPYSNFSDKHGNNYQFESYSEFSKFWFNIPFRVAKSSFPNFKSLQNCAYNSKEARTKI
jgi:hypothetical protein